MSPRVDRPRQPGPDPLRTEAHVEAQDALPWLANRTLAGAELERAQAHVATCAACRADLALLRTAHAAGPGPDLDWDPERALARLQPQLDAAQDAPPAQPDQSRAGQPHTGQPRTDQQHTGQPHTDQPDTGQPHTDQPCTGKRQTGLLQRWRTRLAANDGTWLRAAVAAQFGAIAVLAVLLARTAGQADAPHDYRVLGAAGASDAARLVVTFRPDTPERELRRIVRAGGARIVGGPTVTDAWLLGVDGATAPVLARLRAEPAVTLAEPLAPETRP